MDQHICFNCGCPHEWDVATILKIKHEDSRTMTALCPECRLIYPEKNDKFWKDWDIMYTRLKTILHSKTK